MKHEKHGSHRKHEMAHHKERHSHKKAHHSHKAAEHHGHPHMHEHGSHGGMEHLLGGIVHDSHQEGIHRVVQKKGEMEVGQHGSMSGGWKHGHHMEVHVPKKG